VKRWAKGGESEAADQQAEREALVLVIGERVQALYDEEGTKRWYSGVVVAQNADTGSYHVKFDDGEEGDFQGDNHAPLASLLDCAGRGDISDLCYAGNDADLRRGSWPWAAWLELYLPDLLLTVYRITRQNASLLYLHQLQNPEHFLDEVSEFHHSNFCDVRVLRFEEDLHDALTEDLRDEEDLSDAVSSACTPQTKRRRTGK
jgi:hypothetical protein